MTPMFATPARASSFVLLAASLLLPACGGRPGGPGGPSSGTDGDLQFSELDDFSVESAIWLDVDVEIEEWDASDQHYLVLSNHSGLCSALQEVGPAAAGFADDTTDAIEDDDYDEACEAYRDYYAYLADVMADFEDAGSAFVSIELIEVEDGDADRWQQPRSGDYEARDYDEDEGDFFSLWAMYVRANRFADRADALNDSYDPDSGCFDSEGDMEAAWDDWDEAVDVYRVDEDGDLQLEVSGSTVEALMDGIELVDEDDDRTGEVAGSFTATRCSVDFHATDPGDEFFQWW